MHGSGLGWWFCLAQVNLQFLQWARCRMSKIHASDLAKIPQEKLSEIVLVSGFFYPTHMFHEAGISIAYSYISYRFKLNAGDGIIIPYMEHVGYP